MKIDDLLFLFPMVFYFGVIYSLLGATDGVSAAREGRMVDGW